MIRKAMIKDVKAIQDLISIHAQKGEMLPRSLSELYDNLRDFHIYINDTTHCMSGACAMHICWEGLAEIRSLVVREDFRGKSIGTNLVKACLSESTALGICDVFVLTYQIDFFKKIGFTVVDKSILPQKIWADCLKCMKFPDCDETAMILNL
ncbi:MAG: N-acetyltransferase [Thermodesulfobacteriota bacterium]|nr:N-acetyltransferase [Thermodesulfobacteriota bacterium]